MNRRSSALFTHPFNSSGFSFLLFSCKEDGTTLPTFAPFHHDKCRPIVRRNENTRERVKSENKIRKTHNTASRSLNVIKNGKLMILRRGVHIYIYDVCMVQVITVSQFLSLLCFLRVPWTKAS